MTKVSLNNGGETISDIFPWGIFKYNLICFLSKNITVFPWLLESTFLTFMTKVNPSNRNETKQTFLHGVYSYLRSYVFYQKILKYYNDFQSRNFSVLWSKWTQAIEMKRNQTIFHRTYSTLTSFFIDYKILKYFNDFYN